MRRVGTDTDGGDQNTDTGYGQSLEYISLDQPADGAQCHQHQHGHLSRSEFQSGSCQSRSHKGQDNHTDQAAKE